MYNSMNSQYVSQYGTPQNFQNKPPLATQGFQNVPLGQPKPVAVSSDVNMLDFHGLSPTVNHNMVAPINHCPAPHVDMLQQNMQPPVSNQNHISASEQGSLLKQENASSRNLNHNGLAPFIGSSNASIDFHKFGQTINNDLPNQYNLPQKAHGNLQPVNETNQGPPTTIAPLKIGNTPISTTAVPANDFNRFPRPHLPDQISSQASTNISRINDVNSTDVIRPPLIEQPSLPTQPITVGQTSTANHLPPVGSSKVEQLTSMSQSPLTGQTPSIGQASAMGQPPLMGQPPSIRQSSLMGQPSFIGQASLLAQPSLRQPSSVGQPFLRHSSGLGQPSLIELPLPLVQSPLQNQPARPSSLSGPNSNQFSAQAPKGQYPPSNQFNSLSNQMQNMNISEPRQYMNDNGMPVPPLPGQHNFSHYPPSVRSGDMPGYPPTAGHTLTSGHSDISRVSAGGMFPLPGQPPMTGQPPMVGQPPMLGQPPMVGQPPMPGQMSGISGPYSQHYQQPQQSKRLDPDQMPSPIQVMQDDQRTRSGIFCTNQKGLVPPLITTNFEVQDQGNVSPRFIRSTMYNVPITQDLMKQTSVPFGLIISPMARTIGGEYPPPIVNFAELGPVRCIRCKAYMSPYMQFIDAGRRFHCLFCKATTDVPAEYFQHLDHTGQRADRFERPELILGTYEFTATADYCRNNKFPKPPAIIFVIDVSYNNVKSGLVHLLCSQMKEIIKNLPVDQDQKESNMRVGFITYNTSVHFYNIKGTLAAPQMLVVGDVQDMFMPLLDGFLCTPEESDVIIDALMQQIPAMFGNTRETETILLPAILAGLEALKASECTGKLLVFHSTLPLAEAPGKLKNRDDRKLLGTDKERTVLAPQTQVYNQLGQDCVAAGCAVDLFLFNNSYIDIATIGQVSRLTGGEIFKYTYFQADVDGNRLISDIIMDISRPIAFDTVMRVRTSTGIRATDFYGHLYMSNTTDMEIAAIDCDKAVAVEIKHDDKLTEEDGVYIQVALLYTSCSGQRRLRIMNLSLKTCSQMADLYRCCELDSIINFFGKQSMYKLLEHNAKNVKDSIVARAAQMLANYRKNCASPSSAGQLILPECMKLLPLYVNCLLKSDAMSGGADITIDDRSFTMHFVMTMDIPTSVAYFYPRLIPLSDVKPSADGKNEIPSPIRTSIEKTSDQGAYILENGIYMFLYIGLALNSEFCQQVFGVPTAPQIDVEKCELPMLDNPLSIAVRSIIEQIRLQRHRCMRLTLVRQREKLEPVFKHFLVEDRGIDGSPSYVDFLCHMHKEIRTILS